MKTKQCSYPLFLTIGLIMVTLWSAPSLQAASNIKVSGVMPPFGDVSFFQISPNGRYAVYNADQDTDGVIELYSVLLGEGSPVRLNPLLSVGRNVIPFQISPDSSRVVYWAGQQGSTFFGELYSVPLGGPAAAGIKLNGALVAGGSVNTNFRISPDSSRVVYLADQDTDQVFELYSVPLGGPAAAGVKINRALVARGDVYTFEISPDSSRVVYLASQETATVGELYSVPLGGPAAAGIKLNRALVTGGDVYTFEISQDSSRVVYLASQETATVGELYSVPLGGPAAAGIKVTGALVAGRTVYDYKISPDSSRVVYNANQETATVVELYSVPLGGPAAAGVKLNRALVAGGSLSNYKISPDSSRAVYRADQETASVFELYSVPLGGPAAAGIKLNGVLVAGGSVDDFEEEFQISPDSSRVVYLADQDTDEVFELYSVPLGGPAAAGVKLNRALVAGGFLSNFKISPDSSRVVYLADQDTDQVFELYMTSNSLLHLPLILR